MIFRILLIICLLLALSQPARASWWFQAEQGDTQPAVTFHYDSQYGCQDWQGGACFLGERSYLGPLVTCEGADDADGSKCGFDDKPVYSVWSYLWLPESGGVYKISFTDEAICNEALVAARHRGFPRRKKLRALAPGTFSSRCLFEGATGE